MGANTGIQWTDATWNPIRGCSRVSEGCRHCYAQAVAARFSGPGLPYEGLARRRENGEPQWTGVIRTEWAQIDAPIRWRRPRRIFVKSMSDLFHEGVAVEVIAAVWAVMALAPRHTYQILTKRPARMLAVLSDLTFFPRVIAAANALRADRWPHLRNMPVCDPTTAPELFPQVWLGVSVENQDAALARVPLLVETPAAVRFLSCEPLLGPIDFEEVGSRGAEDGDLCAFSALTGLDGVEPPIPGIDWVIVGGESGPHARPCDINWVADIVAQCDFAGVPVFVKQLGVVPMEPEADWRGRVTTRLLNARNRDRVPDGFVPLAIGGSHGERIEDWPAELQRREFPTARECAR